MQLQARPHSRDALADASGRTWWRDAVMYQVYVRSFCDATGDGVGEAADRRRPGVGGRAAAPDAAAWSLS